MGNFISKFTGKQIDDAIAKALADKSISKVSIDSQGHLIMEFDDENAIDLGEVKGEKGERGDKGDKGNTGAQGPAGSDANVTAANIQAALGYTPVKPSDIPTALKNPNALIFTGAANGSYDGSKVMTIDIPLPTLEPPLFAPSVEWLRESGDVSKTYVLPDGYLYSYQQTEKKPTFTNLFDASTAQLNKFRSATNELSDKNGSVVTGLIPVTATTDANNPTVIRIQGGLPVSFGGGYQHIITYFLANQEYKWGAQFRTLTNGYDTSTGMATKSPSGCNFDPDTRVSSINAGWSTADPIVYAADLKYFALSIPIIDEIYGVALTPSDISDIIITVNEEITYTSGEDWVNTRIEYSAGGVGTTLADKKVLVLGDSISTDAYGNYTKWVTVLKNNGFFPSDVLNSSQHATGFVAQYTGEGQSNNDFIDRITAVADKDSYDLVIVFGGINDYIQNIQMGESEQDKDTYFKPAVDYFFEYLVKNFTQARLVVLSPLRTHNIWKNTAGGSQTTGHYQTEYADYIREVAKKYCLPVLNLTEESGFCPFVDEFKNKWTLIPSGYTSADGVHPNKDYQERYLAPMIKGFLSGLYGG